MGRQQLRLRIVHHAHRESVRFLRIIIIIIIIIVVVLSLLFTGESVRFLQSFFMIPQGSLTFVTFCHFLSLSVGFLQVPPSLPAFPRAFAYVLRSLLLICRSFSAGFCHFCPRSSVICRRFVAHFRSFSALSSAALRTTCTKVTRHGC